jgi:hypothetical protein
MARIEVDARRYPGIGAGEPSEICGLLFQQAHTVTTNKKHDDGSTRLHREHVAGSLVQEIPDEAVTLAMECNQFLIINGESYERRLGLPTPMPYTGNHAEAVAAGGQPVEGTR